MCAATVSIDCSLQRHRYRRARSQSYPLASPARALRMHPALPDHAVSGWLPPVLAHPGRPTSGQVARAGLPLARGGPTCARGQRCRRRHPRRRQLTARGRARPARVVKSHPIGGATKKEIREMLAARQNRAAARLRRRAAPTRSPARTPPRAPERAVRGVVGMGGWVGLCPGGSRATRRARPWTATATPPVHRYRAAARVTRVPPCRQRFLPRRTPGGAARPARVARHRRAPPAAMAVSVESAGETLVNPVVTTVKVSASMTGRVR